MRRPLQVLPWPSSTPHPPDPPPPPTPRPPSHHQVFTRIVCCFTRNTLSTFFCSHQSIAKDNGFSKKNNFFFDSLLVILLLCFYVSVKGFFTKIIITKLRINNVSFAWLPIWPLRKSCGITKEIMVWKLHTVVYFYGLGGN